MKIRFAALTGALLLALACGGGGTNSGNNGDNPNGQVAMKVPAIPDLAEGVRPSWSTITPLVSVPEKLLSPYFKASSIHTLSACKDSHNLYLRMELWESPDVGGAVDGSTVSNRYLFHLVLLPTPNVVCAVATKVGTKWRIDAGASRNIPASLAESDALQVEGNVLELTMPLTVVNNAQGIERIEGLIQSTSEPVVTLDWRTVGSDGRRPTLVVDRLSSDLLTIPVQGSFMLTYDNYLLNTATTTTGNHITRAYLSEDPALFGPDATLIISFPWSKEQWMGNGGVFGLTRNWGQMVGYGVPAASLSKLDLHKPIYLILEASSDDVPVVNAFVSSVNFRTYRMIPLTFQP